MAERGSESLTEVLALVAPGTPLREGLERILQAKRGALVVIGDGPAVLSLCTGGFLLDAEFSPQRLSELAKMDGAIVLARDAGRIARANVHLTPRASVPTSETGTRHRTAERLARSVDVPVIAVSGAMTNITVYRGHERHRLEPTGRVADRASQAISTVRRLKARFDVAVSALSALEVEDSVSLRDVVAVLQPGEMVVRFSEEIEGYLVELGREGRLLGLQLVEERAGVDDALRLVVLDYLVLSEGHGRHGQGERSAADGRRAAAGSGDGGGLRIERDIRVEAVLQRLHALTLEELTDQRPIAAALGYRSEPGILDLNVEARGYRILQRVPRVSDAVVQRIVERFGSLPQVMQASLAELESLAGVSGAKARSVKNGLARLVEASILERYE